VKPSSATLSPSFTVLSTASVSETSSATDTHFPSNGSPT
jgi:hypothetical protein